MGAGTQLLLASKTNPKAHSEQSVGRPLVQVWQLFAQSSQSTTGMAPSPSAAVVEADDPPDGAGTK